MLQRFTIVLSTRLLSLFDTSKFLSSAKRVTRRTYSATSRYYLGLTSSVYHRVGRFFPLTETASANVAALADEDFKDHDNNRAASSVRNLFRLVTVSQQALKGELSSVVYPFTVSESLGTRLFTPHHHMTRVVVSPEKDHTTNAEGRVLYGYSSDWCLGVPQYSKTVRLFDHDNTTRRPRANGIYVTTNQECMLVGIGCALQ